jgi:hypothetical protein
MYLGAVYFDGDPGELGEIQVAHVRQTVRP